MACLPGATMMALRVGADRVTSVAHGPGVEERLAQGGCGRGSCPRMWPCYAAKRLSPWGPLAWRLSGSPRRPGRGGGEAGAGPGPRRS
jgi:hypothetical protein